MGWIRLDAIEPTKQLQEERRRLENRIALRKLTRARDRTVGEAQYQVNGRYRTSVRHGPFVMKSFWRTFVSCYFLEEGQDTTSASL
jgi:hypothetical protein